MANKFYEENDISAIAGAIRSKLGTQTTYKVSEMASAVASIPTGVTPTGTVEIDADQFEKTVDVTNYATVKVYNSFLAGADIFYLDVDAHYIELEIPYNKTKQIQSLAVIPIEANVWANRSITSCFYKWIYDDEGNVDTIARYQTYTTDVKYDDSNIYKESGLTGSYIPNPVVDAENGTITIAGRATTYQWKYGLFLVVISYEYEDIESDTTRNMMSSVTTEPEER